MPTLIADSGSTKTDWCVADNGEATLRVATQGITPIHQTEDEIRHIIIEELCPQITGCTFDTIRFYGSGCTAEKIPMLRCILEGIYPKATVNIYSDLLGAAHALLGNAPGIACILGTGANSCLYDGKQITANTPALGYILGDEGSGAALGKSFLNALYKHRLPETLADAFKRETQLGMSDIIERVYRQPLANRFLASLTTFISKHIDVPELHELVVSNFTDFIEKNIEPYNSRHLPINAVGSIAYYFHAELEEAAQRKGYRIGIILRSPMDGLIAQP
ncbi:MAG: ATPase [Prevotellaceae bacterium]|nr:ATPase [Prevotellaceae bacterium]